MRFNRSFFCSRARRRLRVPIGTDASFTFNPKKFFFVQESVKWVGYIVQRGGIGANPAKLKAIANFPWPQDIIGLCSFWGLVEHLAGFSSSISGAKESPPDATHVQPLHLDPRLRESVPKRKKYAHQSPGSHAVRPAVENHATNGHFNQTRNGYAHHLHALYIGRLWTWWTLQTITTQRTSHSFRLHHSD